MLYTASVINCLTSIWFGQPRVCRLYIDVILWFGKHLIKYFLERSVYSRRIKTDVISRIPGELSYFNGLSVQFTAVRDHTACCLLRPHCPLIRHVTNVRGLWSWVPMHIDIVDGVFFHEFNETSVGVYSTVCCHGLFESSARSKRGNGWANTCESEGCSLLFEEEPFWFSKVCYNNSFYFRLNYCN